MHSKINCEGVNEQCDCQSKEPFFMPNLNMILAINVIIEKHQKGFIQKVKHFKFIKFSLVEILPFYSK